MIASALIGIAFWCAAGVVAVSSADSATARVALQAPWWMFLVGVAVAAAVKPLRTKPLRALPALLTILPWLPIPLPAAAMIWTGPMAWLPIAAAFGLALGLEPLRWIARRLNLFDADDATVAAFVLAATLGGLAAWSANPNTPTGDESHYLMITQSILKDGDIDIQNNHDQRDWESFFAGDLRPDLRLRGIHGEAYSIHAPGVSALVAPPFQLFGYFGARVLLVLLTAIGAMLTWRLCWRLTDSAEAAWFAWAAVVLTPTFAFQSFMVFPDAPGFVIVAAAMLLVVQLSRGDLPGTLPVFLTGVGLAMLPWLHTRFAVVAAGFGAVIALRLMRPAPIPPRPRSQWSEELDLPPAITTEDRVIRLVALLLVPMISAGLWFWFFKAHYDTFDPRAPYGPEAQSVAWIIPGIMALFFDGAFGVAAYAPAIALACVGWLRQTPTFSRRMALETALLVFGYLAAVSSVRMWWAGNPATPARFLMAVLPLVAVPVAVAWTRLSAASRTMASALVMLGAATTAVMVGVDHAGLAWNSRCDNALWLGWLSPVVNLPRAWPAFFWSGPSFPMHVLVWVAVPGGLWLIASRLIPHARTAVVIWSAAALMVLPPLGHLVAGGTVLNAAPAQLAVIRGEGEGGRLVRISAGRFAHLRSLRDTMTLAPLAPGAANECPVPPPMLLSDVPGARYVIHATSTSAAPLPLRLFVGASDSLWREFTVPGPGRFDFPFVLPTTVPGVLIDTDGPERAALTVTLGIEDAMPARGAIPMRRAANFGNADALFLDDQVFVEKDGFWVAGKAAARFMLVPSVNSPVSPLTVRVLVRNGGAANIVTIESGTFQRLLQMAPYQELDVDIPLTPTGNANVRIASGSGFVPADWQPGNNDRRLLGVWIQPR